MPDPAPPPPEALPRRTVVSLVRAATAAPSLHNAQPWRFRFLSDSGTLHLWAALDRVVPHADPHGRALHLSCGAALLNLRCAAAHEGLASHVTLLPDHYDPRLLAAVRLRSGEAADHGLAALYPVIPRRRTSRRPFSPEQVPDAVRQELRHAAEQEGAGLHYPSEWHMRTVLDLVQDAEGRDLTDRWRVEELTRWTRTGAEAAGATDGIPEYAFGPRRSDGRAPVRDFAGRDPVTQRRSAVAFEEHPQLALLGTGEDRPADWLRAGQALERVLLTATGHGVSVSLTSQALEWSELRWPVRDPRSAMGYVQMVLRLGYGPPVPATPRRPVEQVLDVE